VGERQCGGGEMGKGSFTKPMSEGIRASWHGGDGVDRHVHALCREHGHRMVTASVSGGACPGDWGTWLNPFWAADW
jgi:hypothetical protein